MSNADNPKPAPSVILAGVSPWTESDQRRLDGGRRLCLILGIACVLLMAVPIGQVFDASGQGHLTFRWPGHVRLNDYGLFSGPEWAGVLWGIVLLPAIGGGLAIVASFRRPFARGALTAAAGALLMFAGPVMVAPGFGITLRYYETMPDPGFVEAFLVGPLALNTDVRLLMLVVLLIAIVVGGHHAAMRARRHPMVRLPALLPTFLALPPLLYCAIVSLRAMLYPAGQVVPVFGAAPDALDVMLSILNVCGLIALLGVVLTALINAGTASDRVARSGFIFGVVGLPMVGAGLTILAVFVLVRELEFGPAAAILVALHNVLPFAAGVVLLIGGYSRMWLWLVSRTVEAPVHVPEPAG